MRVRKPLIAFIAILQSVLCLTHLLLYETWTFSPVAGETHGAPWIKPLFGLLSVSFIVASLLALRYTNAAVRAFYRVAAVWLGLVSFLFLAAISSWIIFGVARLAGLDMNFHWTVELLFGAAVVAGLYGVFNASWTRITRTTVRLANLPAAWHGRRAALISDMHLGHVRNGSFLRRMVAKILKEEPDAIFIAGDLYDGTAIDVRRAAAPLSELVAPHGVYFVAGNHEQFGDDSKYLHAIAATGVRVLSNENLELDGAADLPAVCVWLKPDREDAGFHFERSRNLGAAAAAGIESRDRNARVPIEFKFRLPRKPRNKSTARPS